MQPGFCKDPLAKEFLLERWYETEFIVFEYLSTLSFNESEQLVLNEARQFPNILTENIVNKAFEDPDNPNKSKKFNNHEQDLSEKIIRTDNRCWGYPALLRKDPLRQELVELGITIESIHDYTRSTDKKIDEQESTIDSSQPVESDRIRLFLGNQTKSFDSPNKLHSNSLIDFLSKAALLEAQLRESAFSWLPEDTFNLKEEYLALRRASGVRPIFHGKWHQPVPERDAATPILLQLDDSEGLLTYDRALRKLEGTVNVTARKFLHLHFNLWHHADSIGQPPIAMPNLADLLESNKQGYMELNESRRMRSSELHYIDHPKIGIITQIQEVKVPDDLIRRFISSTKT